jgi:NADH-quinone oxidoreductase subunit H
MRYAWFMNGEYAAMFTMCAILTTLFLGGWGFPGFRLDRRASAWFVTALVSFGAFITKVALLVFFFMWVRWTLAALPLGSADESGMERAHPHRAGKHHRHRRVPGIRGVPFRIRRLT